MVEKAISLHLATMRDKYNIYNTNVTTIIEANYGGWPVASRIAGIASHHPPVNHMTQDNTRLGRPGVWTSNEVKERMRLSMSHLLRTETITFADIFVSQSLNVLSEICQQLKNYKYTYKEAVNEVGVTKPKLSGKGGSCNDDLCISIQMLAFWSTYCLDRSMARCVVNLS